MPEAPDVEVYKRYIDSTSLHQIISDVTVGDERLLEETSRELVESTLRGGSMESTHRVGKYLFASLRGGSYLLLHFGMTGEVAYFKHPSETPDYTQLLLRFDNDYQFAYVNKRILGRIAVIDDMDAYLRNHQIGPDAVRLTYEEFARTIGRGRGTVKTTMMNQKMMSGLGNVYSDEILFHSGIDPRSKGMALPENKLRDLYRAMHDVVEIAVEARAQPADMPRSFLIHHRDEGDSFDQCPNGVANERVAGRSCYFCPDTQQRY